MRTAKTILIYVAVCLGLTAGAQEKEAPGVLAIRAQFNAINSNTHLTKRVLENDEFLEEATDGGGTLTCYYKNDTVVKIVEWVGLSYGNTTREFYFNTGKILFIYGNVCKFVQKNEGELNYSKTTTAFEGRYYISDNKIIKRVVNENEPARDMGKDIVNTMFTDGLKYFKMFSKKK